MHRRTVLIQLLGLGVAAASASALAHSRSRPGADGWPISSAEREGLPFAPLRGPMPLPSDALSADEQRRAYARVTLREPLLSLWRHGQPQAVAMPAAGTVVAAGDRLVVLASLAALRRVEQGRIRPPEWVIAVQLPDPLGADLMLTLRQILARQLGVAPAEAAALMRGSRSLRLPVDPDCGALLQRDLQHQGLPARLERAAG